MNVYLQYQQFNSLTVNTWVFVPVLIKHDVDTEDFPVCS